MEVLIAMAVFLMIIIVLGFLLYSAYLNSVEGGHRTEAVLLAKEGVEAARSLRDEDFANLTPGAFGLTLAVGNTWTLSGSQDTTGSFVRQVQIEDITSEMKKITSQVVWRVSPVRQGEVQLITYLTNWLKEVVVSFCQGDAWPCSIFPDKQTCPNQQVCSWLEEACANNCSCASLAKTECQNCAGCSWVKVGKDFVCQGSCSCSQTLPNKCLSCPGCSLQAAQCAGSALSCDQFPTEGECLGQAGCSWAEP